MAKNTNLNLRNQSIYQVFTRQHSKTQDFEGIIKDLDRIKSMGFDIVYLLPFHIIGEKDKKGEVGSPYSILDYYSIDPLHGDLDTFKRLKTEVNKRGMKLMMDIVYNHTSRDSVLVNEKPEWFYKNNKGEFANRVGDWSDITDLDLNIKAVENYLIDNLVYWAQLVDGFRCDVAPLLPIEFWHHAKDAVTKVNPDIIWLTESVELNFIKYIRDLGYDASSDSTMYDVFDICYDYDIFGYMDKFLDGRDTLTRWLSEIMDQESIYPKNYIKLRSFENHDQERIASKTKDNKQLIQLTAMMFFIKGMPMVYAGQEHMIEHRPDLFNHDLVNWNDNNSIELLITKLNKLKKDAIMATGNFNLVKADQAVFTYELDDKFRVGIFNLEDSKKLVVNLKDGNYTNLLNNQTIVVNNRETKDLDYPIIIDTLISNKI